MNQLAQQTLRILEDGHYAAPSGREVDISQEQKAAVEGTRLYTPASLVHLMREAGKEGNHPVAQVIDTTPQLGAQNLLVDLGVGSVVLLNFADGASPGGPFLKGGKTQEAELCRCSGLYPALKSQSSYYHEHRSEGSTLGTDHMIYTPDVPFFRLKGRGELLEVPFYASVISSTAPRTGPLRRNVPEERKLFLDTYQRRWGEILAVAEAHNHRNVLLGAWGCGVFGNDPGDAAETLKPWLSADRFRGSFDHIFIAIPSVGKKGQHNLDSFRWALV